jgi:hypothetical protein
MIALSGLSWIFVFRPLYIRKNRMSKSPSAHCILSPGGRGWRRGGSDNSQKGKLKKRERYSRIMTNADAARSRKIISGSPAVIMEEKERRTE